MPSSNVLSVLHEIALLCALVMSASTFKIAMFSNFVPTATAASPSSSSSSTCNGEMPNSLGPQNNTAAIERELSVIMPAKERLSILVPDPSCTTNLTFQYINNTVLPPTGGTIALADINKFPALALGNVAQAIGFMGPCSLNVPHSHPRASEFLTVVQGGPLVSGLLVENGANVVGASQKDQFGASLQLNTTLHLWQGTVFPQGLTHFQFNDNCYPTVFTAAFDNRDPGRSQLAQTFFSVRPDPLIESSLGELGSETIGPKQIDQLRDQIPVAFAVLLDECIKRCGISTKPTAYPPTNPTPYQTTYPSTHPTPSYNKS